MEIMVLIIVGYLANLLCVLTVIDSSDENTLLNRITLALGVIPFLPLIVCGLVLALIFLTPIVGAVSLFGLIKDLLRRKECQY